MFPAKIRQRSLLFVCLQYQAVSQMLADMAIGIEASRLLVYRGAWEADQGRRNTYYASLAKALAADVANKSAADAVQVGGQLAVVCCITVCNSMLHLTPYKPSNNKDSVVYTKHE